MILLPRGEKSGEMEPDGQPALLEVDRPPRSDGAAGCSTWSLQCPHARLAPPFAFLRARRPVSNLTADRTEGAAMAGGVDVWRRRLRRLAPVALFLAFSGVASGSGPAGALTHCSPAPAFAYGATYGSNCFCSSCTVWCNTPRGPYRNGTCC